MGNNNGNQGNQELNNDRGDLLINDNIHINQKVDPKAYKQIKLLRNPFSIKKTSLILERDAVDENKYYIKFTYDSIVNFDCYINFNVSRNADKSSGSKNLNDYVLSYKPSNNFVSKSIAIKNLPKGFNQEFFDQKAVIDMNYFNAKKSNHNDDNTFDVSIELVEINNDIKNKPEIAFVTVCNLEQNEFRIELQKLKIYDLWISVLDIYNSSLDNGECVICCTDTRNTIFMPCRHACTCNACANLLKMRNSACPICKSKIRDLLIVGMGDQLENNEEKKEDILIKEDIGNIISNRASDVDENIPIKDD